MMRTRGGGGSDGDGDGGEDTTPPAHTPLAAHAGTDSACVFSVHAHVPAKGVENAAPLLSPQAVENAKLVEPPKERSSSVRVLAPSGTKMVRLMATTSELAEATWEHER